MGILIWILIGLGGLIATLLIVALFSKKGYSLRREIVIDRPLPIVFDYLRHLKNQDKYSKWVQTDPAMTKSYTGNDGEVGFIYGWNGNKQAGEGEMEIMTIVDGQRIDVQVRFKRPFAAIASTPFETVAVDAGKTKVTWGMSSAMNYPMNLMLLFINMENLLGKDLETSLSALKKLLEQGEQA